MDRKRLLADEDAAWRRLADVLAAIPSERIDDPTVTPDGWSPKDTMFHVAAWLELCADVCHRIASGAWDPSTAPEEMPDFVDRVNAEQFVRARAMTPREVEVRLARARERARTAIAALPEMTPDAWGWFEESGPMHYAKHVHDLAAFSAGVTSDPEIGPLLQAETDAWLELEAALDAVPRDGWDRRSDDGWSAREALHHLVRWLETSTPAVAGNRYWYEGDVPAPEAVVDAMNERFLAEAADAEPMAERAGLERLRSRMRDVFSELPSPTAEAKRTFEWNTFRHYAEHIATFHGAAADGP